MKNLQRGFTLIELVMVIVILGVLSAVAIPRFVDLTGDARTAAAQGVAGALSSGSAINYSLFVARGARGVGVQAVTNCNEAQLTLQGGTYPQGGGTYAAPSAPWVGDAAAAGAVNNCVLTFTPNGGGAAATANFTAIAVPAPPAAP